MQYRLPDSIYSTTQLRQLQSELKRLGSLRSPKNVVFSDNLTAFADANKITKLNLAITKDMLKFVSSILDQTGEITITLASEPSAEERNELVAKFRRMFGKNLIMHIIIQPELLAGATVRTKTGFVDMSLRTALFSNKQKLIQGIKNA